MSTVTGGIFEADMCAIFDFLRKSVPILETLFNGAIVAALSVHCTLQCSFSIVQPRPHVWLEGLVTGSGSAVVGDINRLDWAGSSAACLHQD